MKTYYLPALLFIFYFGNAAALPDCQTSGAFDICYGSFTAEVETEEYSIGDKYIGEFQNDKFDGKGTYTTIEGDIYVGEFKDGEFNGKGTYNYADGDKYVGEFKDSMMQGQGTLTYLDGSKSSGKWKDDKFVPDICEEIGVIPGTRAFRKCVKEIMNAVD